MVKYVDWKCMKQMYLDGWGDRDIGLVCGCPRETVLRWRRENDLPSNYTSGGFSKQTHMKIRNDNHRANEYKEDIILRDDESLFCDGEFIENILHKKIT